MENETPAQQVWHWAKTAPFSRVVPGIMAWWQDPATTDWDRAQYGRLDRYWLLAHLLHRPDILHPWLYERCREVEQFPDGHLDLWAREHYKSTIITFAGIIQEILKNPELTICIFSHTRPIAKAFLKQVKRELETNLTLLALYQDVLYANPQRNSPQWSEDEGIIVKRETNPREATLEAYGLVDGQPTSKHFGLRVYDDVVTLASVGTADQIQKTIDALDMSQNLGGPPHRAQYIGTRYHFSDPYKTIMDRGQAAPRIYPATHNGLIDGNPVLFPPEIWTAKKRDSTTSTLACQMLQNPLAGSDIALSREWIRRYEIRPLTLNVYITVDPARTKKKTSDRTAIAVIGMDYGYNKYLLDGMCHRMSLSERWTNMAQLRTKWRRAPGVQQVHVGYEIYGAHSDFEFFKEKMKIQGVAWPIAELKWNRDAPDSHVDRVQRLEPDFREGRLFLPYDQKDMRDKDHGGTGQYLTTRLQQTAIQEGSRHLVAKPILQRNEDGKIYNLVEWMLENEYDYFPKVHVDFLDALSRMYDMNMVPPVMRTEGDLFPEPEPTY